MNTEKLVELLSNVKSNDLNIEDALYQLRVLPFENIGHAKIDHHRDIRQGIPEVIYCEGKTTVQVIEIMKKLYERHNKALGTRASEEMAKEVLKELPNAEYDEVSKILKIDEDDKVTKTSSPKAMVISAGTSDIPVAEEAAQTLEFLGHKVERAYDIGVAGIHRLFDVQDKLFEADVIICVAGMEGALTSVVGGLVSCPIIGVPTSVGYGTNLKGFAPLLTMLNSCAIGVAVVNIDNGFGAAAFASSILTRILKEA